MTGKEWEAKRAEMFEVGAVIECVENTYIPRLNGRTRVIERPGPTVSICRMDGKPFRMEMPKRVSEIDELPGGAIRYPLGRDDHTVTLRRVS